MKGIKITLLERVQTGKDPFNKPVYMEEPVEIDNVLVAPVTPGGEELLDAVDLQGRKGTYTLAIPKGDTHHWEGNRVRFFGQTWQVIGMPTQGIEELIPLAWNKKVTVDRIE